METVLNRKSPSGEGCAGVEDSRGPDGRWKARAGRHVHVESHTSSAVALVSVFYSFEGYQRAINHFSDV